MKKTLLIILALVSGVAGCAAKTVNEEMNADVIYPLHETVDIDNLESCTVAATLRKGDVCVDVNGKIVMNVKIYNYELYDMADIASLEENDVIVRQNEEVKVTALERLDTGLVRINGGEENGGFDLISNDNTVYYETGMNDIKSYYEVGEVTLPVFDDFEYVDESATRYYAEDFIAEDSVIEYNFYPNNTSIVIENGIVINMNKVESV